MRTANRRALATLSLGHVAADLVQGALPAILVFLKPILHLSYTKTAAVVLVATLTSSITQPFFGIWSDRRKAHWLAPAGVALGGVGIAFAALAPSYGVLLVLVAVSGIGVSAFHPEAMKAAHGASGGRRASGMAVFSFGGNLGFALGPVLAGGAIAAVGLAGGVVLLIPALLVAMLLMIEQRRLAAVEEAGRQGRTAAPAPGHDDPGAFRLLMVVVVLRSVAYYGLLLFVPLWEVDQGRSRSSSSAILSAALLAGAAATLVAGPLADRYGRRVVLMACLLLAPGLIGIYLATRSTIGVVALCLAGAVVVGTFSLTIVMSQEYMPSRIALASGLSVGLGIGLGGVAAIALGGIADALDLRTALIVTAAAPAFGALLSVRLPRDGGQVQSEPADRPRGSVAIT